MIQALVALLEPEYFNPILEKLDHVVFSEQLGFNFEIKLGSKTPNCDPITRSLSDAVAGRRYLLNEPTTGKLKVICSEIMNELLRPPEATSITFFSTAEVVFDVSVESEFHIVD